MMLALQITPELIGSVLSLIGAIVIAILQARGRAREATMLRAVIEGIEASIGGGGTSPVKGAVKKISEQLGVSAALDARVQEIVEKK